MPKKLDKKKAKKILEEGVAKGKNLTGKQKKFFGAVAGGSYLRGLGGAKSYGKKGKTKKG